MNALKNLYHLVRTILLKPERDDAWLDEAQASDDYVSHVLGKR